MSHVIHGGTAGNPVLEPSREGATYEATYLGWVNFLRNLAVAPKRTRVAVPRSWAPFVHYMGHQVAHFLNWFPEDEILWHGDRLPGPDGERRLVEVMSACRPELVHALYEWDTDWRHAENAKARVRHRPADPDHMFVVTGNASFYRPEVLAYLDELHAWQPSYDPETTHVILVPCAADKPYPAPLHKKIRERLTTRKIYQIVVTGVLGLVPEALWDTCPKYDSGLPNQLRVTAEVDRYFGKHYHRHVHVYSDFYAKSIERGALARFLGDVFHWPLGVRKEEDGYLDLMADAHLSALERSINAAT